MSKKKSSYPRADHRSQVVGRKSGAHSADLDSPRSPNDGGMPTGTPAPWAVIRPAGRATAQGGFLTFAASRSGDKVAPVAVIRRSAPAFSVDA
jgi:hypothetical protein